MKVLFIGGTGNISGACTRWALKKGMDVFHLNRRSTESPFEDRVHTFQADIHDDRRIKQILRGHYFDVIVNFIAFVPDDIQRDFQLFHKNTSQYIFISSASVYQKPPAYPVINESTPLKNPYWKYSRDKIDCEEYLQKLYRDSDFPVTIIRPSLTYETVIPAAIGCWDDFTLIDRIRKGGKIIVHGDGTSLWTVTHSEDFAKGFVGLLGNLKAIGHAFHITTDEVLTWNQLNEIVGKTVGVNPRLVHIPSEFIANFMPEMQGSLLGDKAFSAIFDNSKIKKYVPDFKATIPFKEGIRRTIDRFESHPDRQNINQATDELMDKVIELYETAFNGVLK